MTRLTKENIQFIDRYLSSEIIFMDIRTEMVDHIGSVIEQKMIDRDPRSFYYIFKDYMIKNKRLIYKSNTKFLRSVDYNAGKRLLKNVFSLKGIIVFITMFFCFNTLSNYLEPQLFLKTLKNSPMFVLLLIGSIYLINIKRSKERYSAIERLGIYFILIYQFIYFFFSIQIKNFDFINENTLLSTIIATFLITTTILLLFTAFQYKKEYRLKFKNV